MRLFLYLYFINFYHFRCNLCTLCSFLTFFSLSDRIYNSALHHRWHDFKYNLTSLYLPIDLKFLYNLNMNNRILGFCYGLLQSRKENNKMLLIIRIIPHPDFNQNLWAGAYRYLEPLPKNTLNVPLNINICKRLHIVVNEAPISLCSSCIECKKPKYYIGSGSSTSSTNITYYCFNTDCSSFSNINLDTIPVYNNGGDILYTFQQVEHSSQLRNNLSIVTMKNCNKCNSCKQCTKKKIESNNAEKCKRHKICTHTKKSSFRKRDMLHSLNLLSHERAKEHQKKLETKQQQYQY